MQQLDGDLVAALRSHGCTISAHSADMSNLLMLLIAALYWLTGKLALLKTSCRNRRRFLCSAIVVLTSNTVIAKDVSADDVDESNTVLIGNVFVNTNDDDKQDSNNTARPAVLDKYEFGRIYVGVGLGLSYFAPEIEPGSPLDVEENFSIGGSIMLGWELHRRFSAELLAADLRSIDLDPAGTLGYRAQSLSGLLFLARNLPSRGGVGISPYLRAGFRRIKLDRDKSLPIRPEAEDSLLLGAGVQVDVTSHFGARLDFISFAGDVRFLQAVLLYRFGGDDESLETAPSPTYNVNVVNKINIQKPDESADADQDDIPDDVDECPETRYNLAVSENGCAIYDGVIRGVNFETASHELTPNAKTILRGVVDTLTRFPDTWVTVAAHTDSRGTESYNQSLSERRAHSVVSYLVANGISSNRLRSTAYGETRPIATNTTAIGMASNRRVEFVAERSGGLSSR